MSFKLKDGMQKNKATKLVCYTLCSGNLPTLALDQGGEMLAELPVHEDRDMLKYQD